MAAVREGGMSGALHVVGLSGGKDSTALALALLDREPREYAYVCTPTGDELPEMEAHWNRLAELLGQPLVRLSSGKTLNSLIEKYGALPNWRQRWCTRELKIEPYRKWLTEQARTRDVVSYIGLRADEEDREGVNYANELDLFARKIVSRFPLREWGWGLAEVWDYLDERGVAIPARTDCGKCYAQQLIQWRDLLFKHPDRYAEAEKQEADTGHTFRSPGRDTWPAALKDLRKEFERGRPLRERKDERGKVCRVCSL
jgi:3'-phosphoadenosine 5'-phosphosulfate sulfotransferase (PAPS reductase)/FAD synthetase